MVTINADGRTLEAQEGEPLLEALGRGGIEVPTLCHLKHLSPTGACRMCVVEIEGQRGLQTACTQTVRPGMVVQTQSDLARRTRKDILDLLLSEHRVSCVSCDKNGDCRLMQYTYEYGADQYRYGPVNLGPRKPNYTSESKAISYDPQLCIRCGRCVRVCEEDVMVGALTFTKRGSRMEVSTAFDMPLHETACELCGQCVAVCPTGAMYERAAMGKGQCKDLTPVRTTCPYCGVGCQMDLQINGKTQRIVRITAPTDAQPNEGALCVKGRFAFQFVHSPQRLTTPLIRENGSFRAATWEEALALVGRKLRQIRDTHGPDALAFLSSCRCTNEENYLAQKLARAAGLTNNIDQCATTCHAPTVAGLAMSFGSGAMTNSIAEIKHVDTLLVIGANPTEAHPIVGLQMKRALRRGAKLIVCDPRKTWIAQRAHLHIQHRPGTDNMLVNAMMSHLIERGLYDRQFVAERCESFEVLRDSLRGFNVEKAAEICGVKADDIRRAAQMYAAGKPSSIFYTLGITEHTCGTENVQNLANLAMLCGQIGKPSSGVNPLRGQNNVQGGCDMGGIHNLMPGYQKIDDPAVRRKFTSAWGVDLPTNRGGRVTDFIEQAHAGTLRAFYVFGEDPVSSEPNQDKVVESLGKLEFLVCQDIFMSETAKLAHVVLPASSWAEKDGTFTNTERRVQRVRKAIDPPGQAKADWEILCLVGQAMGYPMNYRHPQEIFDEMARLTPSYAGMSYQRIDANGLQWPCPAPDHPGTQYLHKDRFVRGRGLFHAIAFRPPAEVPDDEFPFVLSTGRTLYHYNVGNQTGQSDAIRQKQSENFVEMHEQDAAALGVQSGDDVLVRTRRGELKVRAMVGQRVRPGALWMPFHFADSPTNRLTNDAFDTVTRTAEYKCCAAAVTAWCSQCD